MNTMARKTAKKPTAKTTRNTAPRNTAPRNDRSKKLGGTYKASRAKAQVPQADPHTVQPVWEQMSREMLATFEWLRTQLSELGVLHQADAHTITEFAFLSDKLRQAYHECNAPGIAMHTTNDKGAAVLTPQWATYTELNRMLTEKAKLLPLSPKNRRIILAGVFSKTKDETPTVPMARPQLSIAK